MVGVRAKDHEEKRRLILDTASGLFARQGFSKTSISELSTACSASKAWIYHYFPTKEDILFTLLRDFLLVVRARLGAIDVEGLAPDVALHLFILECLRIYDDYRINYPVLFNEMTVLTDDQQVELRAIEDAPVKLLTAIVAKIRPEIAQATAFRTPITLLIYGTINWTYTWFNPDGKLRLEQLALLVRDFVLGGIQTVDVAKAR
jgi:AcrR family transcriptional regulator